MEAARARIDRFRVGPRRAALLETAEFVLRRERRPMRVAEIRAAANLLLERELHPSALKQALSANLKSRKPRFRRMRHGVYGLAESHPRTRA